MLTTYARCSSTLSSLRHMAISRLAISASLAAALAIGIPASAAPAAQSDVPTLTGFASLPAATFVPASEPSGALIGAGPFYGVTVPFADQPVQGFSGIARNRDGSFDVLSDNGYGSIGNSADFDL